LPSIPQPFRVDPGVLDTWLKETAEAPEAILERTAGALQKDPDDAEAHHQRGHALYRLSRWDAAVVSFTAALKVKPDDPHLLISRALVEAARQRLDAVITDADAALRLRSGQPKSSHSDGATRRLALFCNNEAWRLATGPAAARDPARAVTLSRRAVELLPDEPIYINTLGVALYRDAQYAQAASALNRSLAAGKGETDAFDLFFLAMARHRLGDSATARADFERALRWLGGHPDLDARWLVELKSFRAEAESVLASPSGELPGDVFAPGRAATVRSRELRRHGQQAGWATVLNRALEPRPNDGPLVQCGDVASGGTNVCAGATALALQAFSITSSRTGLSRTAAGW
jgi:tetratricopeptide (TPR) repeat protein